ncbi:MAG: hypothetical protein MR966_01635 [Lachnospiraceae bacterium]|nr:hypothetical protein [Lachnospiraceae bacterium]
MSYWQLEQTEDMETLETQADEILQQNSFVALAWRIRDKPELELSDEYRVYIEEMRIRIMKQPE